MLLSPGGCGNFFICIGANSCHTFSIVHQISFLSQHFIISVFDLSGVPPGWSTLMKLCEIQPARPPYQSTSTNHPPSCTRSSNWAPSSCSMTTTAQNRWWILGIFYALSFYRVFISPFLVYFCQIWVMLLMQFAYLATSQKGRDKLNS